jgi:hypothetical protein
MICLWHSLHWVAILLYSIPIYFYKLLKFTTEPPPADDSFETPEATPCEFKECIVFLESVTDECNLSLASQTSTLEPVQSSTIPRPPPFVWALTSYDDYSSTEVSPLPIPILSPFSPSPTEGVDAPHSSERPEPSLKPRHFF